MEPQGKINIIEASCSVHASLSFILESCFFLTFTYLAQFILYIMLIFFTQRRLYDFCIEAFPEFLHYRDLGTAICLEEKNLGLNLELHLHSKLTELPLVIVLLGLFRKLVIKIERRAGYSQASPSLPLLL